MQNDINTYSKHDIPSLTGLRFFAAAFVCLAHVVPYIVPGLDPVIERLSAEGMTLFFILSGFVIHYNYSSRMYKNPISGIYNFFISRFARLYPLYFLCLCLDLLKNYGYSTLPGSLNEAIPFYLSMTQSWIYKPLGNHALIYQFGLMPAVSWSVSTEWFFYLVYPVIAYAILRLSKTTTKMSILLLLFILMPLLVRVVFYSHVSIDEFAVSKFGDIASSANHQDSFYRWLVYFSPYSRISEFLVGCVTASIYMQMSSNRPSKTEERVGLIILIIAIISVMVFHHFIFAPPENVPGLVWISLLHQCFGFAPPIAIIIFCSARYHNFITRFLSNPTILLGGEISYSIYLLHLPIAEAFSRDAAPVTSLSVGLADFTRLFIAAIAILGAALITYRIVEVPARKFIRRWLMIRGYVNVESKEQVKLDFSIYK